MNGSAVGGFSEWLQSVPIPVWLGLLAVGVLMSALGGRRKTPRIYARQAGKGRLFAVLWRTATGAHLDGQLRTDAGWWERGTKDLTPNTKAPKWAYLPRGIRALIRWGSALAVVIWVWGYSNAPGVTGVLTLAGLILAAVLIGRASWRARQRSQHATKYLEPIHAALAKDIGWDPKVTAASWVNVPPDLATNPDAMVTLLVPPGFFGTPEQRWRIDSTVASTLGIDLQELDIYYNVQGTKPHIAYAQYGKRDPHLRGPANRPPVQRGKRRRTLLGRRKADA